MLSFHCIFALLITRVCTWCLETGQINAGEKVFELDYSPNMEFIVIGLETKTRVYYASNRSLLCTYVHGSLNFGNLKFFPSNDKFAFGIEHDDLRIINTSNCVLLNTFSTGHSKVHKIDFNRDGTKMLTCG